MGWDTQIFVFNEYVPIGREGIIDTCTYHPAVIEACRRRLGRARGCITDGASNLGSGVGSDLPGPPGSAVKQQVIKRVSKATTHISIHFDIALVLDRHKAVSGCSRLIPARGELGDDAKNDTTLSYSRNQIDHRHGGMMYHCS
jgi:hypothetical protein